ncbi:unnamed protein product, partial [Arctogadus glacialis]
PTEAPEMYLRRRPLATPFILVGEEDCFLCAGNAPVVSFGRSSLAESVLYVMAYYYAFHMTPGPRTVSDNGRSRSYALDSGGRLDHSVGAVTGVKSRRYMAFDPEGSLQQERLPSGGIGT